MVSPAVPDPADLAIEEILERKGSDILQLDISKCSDLADSMVICTARSTRQTQAIANYIAERLKKAGFRRLSIAGLSITASV